MRTKVKRPPPLNVGDVIDRLREFAKRFTSRSAMEKSAGLAHGTVGGWFTTHRNALPKCEDLVRLASVPLVGGAHLSLDWLLLGEGAPFRRQNGDELWAEVREHLISAVAAVVKEPRHAITERMPSPRELESRLVVDAVSSYLVEARRAKRLRSNRRSRSIADEIGDYLKVVG